MSKSNNQKKAKLKANIEDFVEPLLKQLDNFPQNEVFSEIYKLVEDVAAQARNRESEQISLMEEIERQLDYWKENKEDNSKLLENFNKILRKYNVKHLARVSIDSIQEEATSPGEPTKNNNQEYDSSVKLEELELDQQHKDCLHILSIFPENTKMKKRLLIYWWIGLGIFPSENITNTTHTTMEQQGETIFSDLVSKGILVPVHTRKHNKVIDQCIVNPTIHQQLIVRYQKTCCHEGGMSIYSDDEHNVRALLNVDQKYLSSKEIKNILGDNAKPLQVVSLGRWTCTTKVEVDDKIVSMGKKSPDHIELDGTDFLKKFGEKVTFLSLRGISGFDVLSKSIGELGDLRILDLRSCHNLEKLPQKPVSRLRLSQGKRKWFNNLTHLDMSECYLLDHMPKWICDLSNLEVLKGFVASNAGKKLQFCQLGDLKKLKKLRKLSIKIAKHLDPNDANGLESLERLSRLTVIWSIHEHRADNGKVQTISFPKNLEKLDIRCYPNEEATPAVLPYVNRLYIIGGKLNKIVGTEASRNLKILRLRFLKYLKIDWFELNEMFTNLELVECKKCPNLTTFPITRRGVCYPKKKELIPIDDDGSDDDDDNDNDGMSRRVGLKIINNLEAPLYEHNHTLMLELTGNVCGDRPGLALVAVLDVCKELNEDNKLEKLKAAIRFVISKLSYVDYFSIVIFSKESTTLWPLQKMTETCKKEIEYVVNNLKADDTELGRSYEGLQMGLNILKDPKFSSKSMVKSIILVSSVAGSAKHTDFIANVVVHTFGFGKDHRPWELMRIAEESIGGTYSSVRNTNNLTKAIAVCLAGLLTVVVQDLVLTFAPIEESSALMDVRGAANSTWRKQYSGPVDVSYGNLYGREVRKVLVTLSLPDVYEEGSTNILIASYSYKVSGKIFQSDPVIITANRMKMMPSEKLQVPPEVMAERTRINILWVIRSMAQYTEQRVGWYCSIYDDDLRNSEDELCKLLCKDYDELLSLKLKSKGERAYAQSLAWSLVTCHNEQRATARGDDIEGSIRSFGTPSMFKFLKGIENGEHLE